MDLSEWVLDPFSNTELINFAKLKKEFIEVTTNEELKLKFKGRLPNVLAAKAPTPILDPGLWAVVLQTFLIPFLPPLIENVGSVQ